MPFRPPACGEALDLTRNTGRHGKRVGSSAPAPVMHEVLWFVMTMLGSRMGEDEPDEVQRWAEQPLTEGELDIVCIADWGATEDWSDWVDATR